MTVAALDKSTVAVVLSLTGLSGAVDTASVAVVLGSAGLPGTLQKSSVAAVLVQDLPALVSESYAAGAQVKRIWIGATPVMTVYLGDTEIFRQE